MIVFMILITGVLLLAVSPLALTWDPLQSIAVMKDTVWLGQGHACVKQMASGLKIQQSVNVCRDLYLMQFAVCCVQYYIKMYFFDRDS